MSCAGMVLNSVIEYYLSKIAYSRMLYEADFFVF